MKLSEMSDEQLQKVLKEAKKRLTKKQRVLESHRKTWNERVRKKREER